LCKSQKAAKHDVEPEKKKKKETPWPESASDNTDQANFVPNFGFFFCSGSTSTSCFAVF
jgi:hypothetical protein